jgi:biotin carboxyl carrier protein
VHVLGGTYAVTELPPPRRGAAAGSHDGDVRSPMPGAVIAVRVAAGDEVAKGDVLLVVEAMKMEHALGAPFDGVVSELGVRQGDQVVVDQLLATVTASESG